MNHEQIQRAVKKFLLITSRYGWSYSDLEDTYLDMPFYAISYQDGEYILPAKRPHQFEEPDIDYLQTNLDEFLSTQLTNQMDDHQAWLAIQKLAMRFPDESQGFFHIVRAHPRQGYLFRQRGNSEPLLSWDEVMQALNENPDHVYLEHHVMAGLDYINHYQTTDIFNLKRPDVKIPPTPLVKKNETPHDDNDKDNDNHQKDKGLKTHDDDKQSPDYNNIGEDDLPF